MRWLAFAVLLGLSACSSPGAAPPEDGEALDPAAFDLSLVKSNYHDECADPIVVDELFCQQVEIDGMSADGSILNVPTTLNAESRDRAAVICEFLATVHYDGATGDDLGYDTIGVLDRNGKNLAACTVAP